MTTGLIRRSHPPEISTAVTKRQDECLRLKILGLTLAEIYDNIVALYGRENLPPSYSIKFVSNDIGFALGRLRKATISTANDLRIINMQRLEQLYMISMNEVANNTGKIRLQAIGKCVQLLAEEAKLYGAYAPTEVKVNDWRTQLLELVKAGNITRAELEAELGEEVVRELIDTGSPHAIEGRFVEAQAGNEEPDQSMGEMAGEEPA